MGEKHCCPAQLFPSEMMYCPSSCFTFLAVKVKRRGISDDQLVSLARSAVTRSSLHPALNGLLLAPSLLLGAPIKFPPQAKAAVKLLTAGAGSKEKQQLLQAGWGDEESMEEREENPHYDPERYAGYSQRTRSNLVRWKESRRVAAPKQPALACMINDGLFLSGVCVALCSDCHIIIRRLP